MKIRARVMTIVFVLIVATIAIVNAAMPKKDFSENENRVLAEFPKLTWESLFVGTPTVDETGRETKQIWTTDFETYISDHFMFRDHCRKYLMVCCLSGIERRVVRREKGKRV